MFEFIIYINYLPHIVKITIDNVFLEYRSSDKIGQFFQNWEYADQESDFPFVV